MENKEKLFIKWIEKLLTIKEAYNHGCVSLTNWEGSFLTSIENQLHERKKLSWKQSKCLNSIYEKIE